MTKQEVLKTIKEDLHSIEYGSRGLEEYEIKDLINEIYKDFEKEVQERILRWRNIEPNDTICKDCNGSGVKTYGNTSTWRGGLGGAAMTNDVCDKCWGSGVENRKWTNLKLQGVKK